MRARPGNSTSSPRTNGATRRTASVRGDPPARRPYERCEDQEEAERRVRVGERLLDDASTSKRAPGSRAAAAAANERRRRADEQPRQRVGREGRSASSRATPMYFAAAVRGVHVVEATTPAPSGTCRACGSRAARRVAPRGRSRRSRARSASARARREKSHGVEVPTPASRRGREPEEDAEQRDGGEQRSAQRARAALARGSRRPCDAQSAVGAEHDAADRGRSRGGRSGRSRRRRRTRRRRGRAARAARRDRDEDGVRARVRSARASISSSAAERRGRPGARAARRRGSSSTKPTTCSPAVSRSSRSRLRPPRPAPTISVRVPVAARRSGSPRRDERALPEARRADERRCRGARR